MIRLEKLTQFLISDPSEDPLVLVIKKPLPWEDKKCVDKSHYHYKDGYKKKSKMFWAKIFDSSIHSPQFNWSVIRPTWTVQSCNQKIKMIVWRSFVYERKIRVFKVATGFRFPMSLENFGENLQTTITNAIRIKTYAGKTNFSHVFQYASNPLIKQVSKPCSKLSHATMICGEAKLMGSEVLLTMLAYNISPLIVPLATVKFSNRSTATKTKPTMKTAAINPIISATQYCEQ